MNNNLINIENISIAEPELLKKLLGPTFDDIGKDLSTLYAIGRDKVLNAARKKIKNIDDGAKANLRVTHDIILNGCCSDEDICAEYFGGILATSRSEDGKDDTGIFYSDIIKSLSSKQLHFHYIIYNALNKIFLENKMQVNVALGSDLQKTEIAFDGLEIMSLGCTIDIDLPALYSKGLISNYKYDSRVQSSTQEGAPPKFLSYEVKIIPTPLGIQLFAVANNQLKDWLNFSSKNYEDFENIKLVNNYSLS